MTETRDKIAPERPAQIVARRVREARNSRHWTQAELAERLREVGYPKTRETLTKLESGRNRDISIDDVFALAAALGMNPVYLLTPLDDEVAVAVTNRVHLSAAHVRAWIRGSYVPPMLPDVGFDFSQIPEKELDTRVRVWLMRQWNLTPLTKQLMAEEFEAAVTRLIDLLRNPPKEDENDG